jgi:hypothetical protein
MGTFCGASARSIHASCMGAMISSRPAAVPTGMIANASSRNVPANS